MPKYNKDMGKFVKKMGYTSYYVKKISSIKGHYYLINDFDFFFFRLINNIDFFLMCLTSFFEIIHHKRCFLAKKEPRHNHPQGAQRHIPIGPSPYPCFP